MSATMQQVINEINMLKSAAAVRGASAGYASKFIEDGRRDYFAYQATALTLAPGASSTDQVIIQADANFYWTKTQVASLIADDAPVLAQFGVVPAVTVQIQDTGSSRNIFDEPIPVSAMAGQTGLPFVLDYPRLIMRSSTLQVTFQNITDNTTYSDIFLTFIGFKVYPGG